MSTTLRDFIVKREGEIREQQKALKAELRELQIAKTALEGAEVARPTTGVMGLTIKDMAREILGKAPDGLNSSGILDAMRQTFAREVERTSLSPQLSRLKDDDELVLDGELWFTKNHWLAAKAKMFDDHARDMEGRGSKMNDEAEAAGHIPPQSWPDLEDEPPF